MSTLHTHATHVTRIDIKNILFATDFSAISESAVPYLTALAGRYGSTVFLAHVYPPEATYEVPMAVSPDFRHNRAAAEEAMTEFLRDNDFSDISHTVCLRAGDVWMELSDLIAANDIDLMVLGTHGRKGIKGLLLGSVAEEVIRMAPCPVLTVAPRMSRVSADGQFRHIVYATNFSPASQRALDYALSLAQENNAQLTLLHVIDEPALDINEDWPDAELAPSRQLLRTRCASARERLCSMLPSGSDLWCSPELLVQVGPAPDTLLQIAEARHADLIVMGARHSRMPHAAAHVPWRTIHRVLCDAHCPVLTVRE